MVEQAAQVATLIAAIEAAENRAISRTLPRIVGDDPWPIVAGSTPDPANAPARHSGMNLAFAPYRAAALRRWTSS